MTKQENSKPQAGGGPADTAAPSPALGPAPVGGPAAPNGPRESDGPVDAKPRDNLVVGSIVIASIAVTVMSSAQLGMSLSVSVAMGAVTLALLMLIHKQMQKSAQIAQLQAELAQSRQTPRQRTAPRAASVPAPSSSEARIRELSRDIGNMVPRSDPGPNAQPTTAGSELERSVRRPMRSPMQPPMEGAKPSVDPSLTAPPIAAAPVLEEPIGPQLPPQGEIVREHWSFRPRTDAQVNVQDPSSGPVGMNPSPTGASVVTTVEGDLELVQRKIKELADEVNAAEALKSKPARVVQRPKAEASALENSIGALRAAAKSMRQRPSLGDFVPKFEAQAFAPNPTPEPAQEPTLSSALPKDGFGELVIPASAERIAGSDPVAEAPINGDRDVASPSLELPLPNFEPAVAALPPRAAAIVRAVEDDAIELLLGPIVTLAEHSVSHYEMSAVLRGMDGEPLEANDDDFAVIGGDLDTQFDIARLNRAAALATRMDAREREGSLLADFLGTSMVSRAFLESFAHAYEARKRISAQLVLTFSQRAVDGFSPAAWQAVRDMHSFGFRMALDKVLHMGTDFATLQRSGFRFVRIDAQALLTGMSTPERFVPAEEVVQRATLAGLSIIASGIQDAGTQKRLLDAGILLGQGPLFGAPRQVNVEGGPAGSPDQSAAA